MRRAQDLITTSDLRNLMRDLLDSHANVCLRYRLVGEMWKGNFLKVVELTRNGVVFNDESIHEFAHLADLSDVMQFEIDARFGDFEPHYHYEVQPTNRSTPPLKPTKVKRSGKAR